MWLALLVLGAYSQHNDTNPSSRATGSSTPSSTLTSTGKGVTYGFLNYETVGQDQVAYLGCNGNPVPICNLDFGDTFCNTPLPILCVKKYSAYRPCYITFPSLLNKQGWVEGSLALTDPIPLNTFSSKSAADSHCTGYFGLGWVMAEIHDGIYCTNMGLYCRSTWPTRPDTFQGTTNLYGWANFVPPTTRFWVFNNSPPPGISHCFI